MVTPKMIEKETMNSEKKKTANTDYFAYYIGRPLSYVLTIPFLYTNITPNTMSIFSVFPLIIGFILIYLAKTK